MAAPEAARLEPAKLSRHPRPRDLTAARARAADPGSLSGGECGVQSLGKECFQSVLRSVDTGESEVDIRRLTVDDAELPPGPIQLRKLPLRVQQLREDALFIQD